jgi:hypothetical protein
MLVVPIVLVVAAAAILGAVVVVAMGRGGELALFDRDLPAARFRLRTAADVAGLWLPTGLFGYHPQVVADVLRELIGLIASQEAEIASLRDEVRRLSAPMGAGSVSVEPGVAAEHDGILELPPPPL